MSDTKKTHKKEEKNFMSLAERKYKSALHNLKSVNRNIMTKQQQVDISYLINDIEKHGFDFFPNHYVFDKIEELEEIINNLLKQENGRYVRNA